MYPDLKGKTAIVTGSGKKTGIGCAIARKLAGSGADIIIADLGEPESQNADGQVSTATGDEMQAIAAEISESFGVRCESTPLDVTDKASIEALTSFAERRFETIDILCNNAGASFGVPCDVANYDEAAWMKTIDINLHGVFRVSRSLVPFLKNAGGGSIINTASRAGKVPPLFNGAYAVAKAGVIMLTKVMARELAGEGIRVNALCPGQIMTDIEKWRFELEARFMGTTPEAREQAMCETIPLGRIGTPDEVGDLAAFLASSASAYMTGQAVNITGGQLMEL
jgi:NAD(P)-dependent dehydrogenase (short-subunit alcohol dehydrogenase family)